MPFAFVSSSEKAHHHPAVRRIQDATGLQCTCWRDVEGCNIHNVELLAEALEKHFDECEDQSEKLDKYEGAINDAERELKNAHEKLAEISKYLTTLAANGDGLDPEEEQSEADALREELDAQLEDLNDAIGEVGRVKEDLGEAVE